MFRKTILAVFAVLAAFMVNCAGGEGNFKILLTDAPIDEKLGKVVESVNVTIEKVSVRKKGDAEEKEDDNSGKESAGWVTVTEESKAVNLLELQNDVTTTLGNAELEAGEYTEIRVQVSEENTIVFENDTTEYDLKIPSGSSSGIKIKTSFEITDEEQTEVILDFDAADSVSAIDADQYRLSPVIKVKSKKD